MNNLTVKQVADRLGISLSFAYRLIHDGEIRARKHGSTIRVREADLARYEDRTVISTAITDKTNPLPPLRSRRGAVEDQVFKYIKPRGPA